MTREDISKARSAAIAKHQGKIISMEERRLMNLAIEEMSPENFFMDGELFT